MPAGGAREQGVVSAGRRPGHAPVPRAAGRVWRHGAGDGPQPGDGRGAVGVTDHVRACTPVLYVTDLARSARFYQLLGYAEQASGQDSEWAYRYLKTGACGLLLAAGTTVARQTGPVTLYLQVHDADAVAGELRAAGVPVEHLGHPDHAPGGELKVTDPDGYVLLLGQVTGAPPAQ